MKKLIVVTLLAATGVCGTSHAKSIEDEIRQSAAREYPNDVRMQELCVQ